MTDDLGAWPALDDLHTAPREPWVVDCHHAIWGKAHGARTDYRCLGESAGMQAEESGIIADANLGGEEVPRRAQAWKPLTRMPGHAAVGFYESHAIDATGRRRFLEKHVITWNDAARVPFVAAALLMLRDVAALDDSAWWSTRDDPRWHDPGHRLALERRTLRMEAGELGAEVSQALGELAEYVAGDVRSLRTLLRALLAGVPAVLAGQSEPPPFRVLVALLLPFPADEARRLQLTAWMPTLRWPEPAAWDVVFCQTAASDPSPVRADAAIDERAARMAEALLSRAPRALDGHRGGTVLGIGLRRAALSMARSCDISLPEGQPEAWGRILGQGLPFDDLARGLAVLRTLPEARELVRDRVAAAAGQGDRGAIARLVDGAATDADRAEWLADWLAGGGTVDAVPAALRAPIEALLAFAVAGDQHWLSMAALADMRLRPFVDDQDPRARLLIACVRRVEREIPTAATPRSWTAKAALLRSAAIALCPGSPEARQWAESWPGPTEVSPLLVTSVLEEPDALSRLGRHALDRAVQESKRTPRTLNSERLRRVESWCASSGAAGGGGAFGVVEKGRRLR